MQNAKTYVQKTNGHLKKGRRGSFFPEPAKLSPIEHEHLTTIDRNGGVKPLVRTNFRSTAACTYTL